MDGVRLPMTIMGDDYNGTSHIRSVFMRLHTKVMLADLPYYYYHDTDYKTRRPTIEPQFGQMCTSSRNSSTT